MARCDRCGREEDHHGLFGSDGQRICWTCFKKDEIKNDLIGEKARDDDE